MSAVDTGIIPIALLLSALMSLKKNVQICRKIESKGSRKSHYNQ